MAARILKLARKDIRMQQQSRHGFVALPAKDRPTDRRGSRHQGKDNGGGERGQ